MDDPRMGPACGATLSGRHTDAPPRGRAQYGSATSSTGPLEWQLAEDVLVATPEVSGVVLLVEDHTLGPGPLRVDHLLEVRIFVQIHDQRVPRLELGIEHVLRRAIDLDPVLGD